MRIEEIYKVFKKSTGITTDSRNVPKDSIFLALKGERFDGNKYAASALEKGALAVIIDDPSIKKDDRFILVEDGLKTLQLLARHHRRQFDIPVLGITGTNGKTTTKELLYGVIAKKYETHYTQGNFNNHIGVPLTLLAMREGTEFAIIEMGANKPGDIKELAEIAEPTHGLLTNVGKAHLEGFGSFEGVKKTKSELYDFLAANKGEAFVNKDVPFLPELSSHVPQRIMYPRESEIRIKEMNPFLTLHGQLDGKHVEIRTRMVGAYNFANMQAAIVAGQHFNVPTVDICAAISAYLPGNNRSQIVDKGSVRIILDAYNANPTSMENALANLKAMDAVRKIAILGDMLELGEVSKEEHTRILHLANQSGFDKVITIGPLFKEVNMGNAFESTTEFLKKVGLPKEDTLILVKGSRGIRMEKLIEG